MSSLPLILSLALLAAPAAPKSAAPDARRRTEALIAAFEAVPATVAKPSAAQKAAREKAFERLDAFFDYDTIVSAAIAPRAERMKPAELARFKARFRELIRLVAYPDSGDFFRRAQRRVGAPREKPNGDIGVPVDLVLAKEDLQTEVEFVWRASGSELRLVDVAFEGDSLVLDYQNQIARIFDKSGARGLFKALDERQAELEKESP